MRSAFHRLPFLFCGLLAAVPCGDCSQRLAAAEPAFYFSCRADNDLYVALSSGGTTSPRYDSPAEAVKAASKGAGVLILADGYPEKPTVVEPAVFDEAAKKKLRLFVEYPAALPDMNVGPPKDISRVERAVVVSDLFGDALRPMRVATVNACRVVQVDVANPHLVMARVAGVDDAVFGLKDTPTTPLLFDHPRGDLLVATGKLSHFVTGRYMPCEAWRTIWQTILGRLQPVGAAAGEIKLSWTPTVRPTFGRDEPLPADVEMQAVRRSVEWFHRSRLFRAPSWPKAALDRSLGFGVLSDMPGADCIGGDGSLGVLEGFSSTIRLDGSQPMRYSVRNDCMSCKTRRVLVVSRSPNRELSVDSWFQIRMGRSLFLYVWKNDGNQLYFLEGQANNVSQSDLETVADENEAVGYHFNLESAMGRTEEEPFVMLAVAASLAKLTNGLILLADHTIENVPRGGYRWNEIVERIESYDGIPIEPTKGVTFPLNIRDLPKDDASDEQDA